MADDRLITYVAALVGTARISGSIRNPFFIEKFHQKIYSFVDAYHRFLAEPGISERSHLLSCIDSLIDLVEFEEHLQRSDPVSLAYAKRGLLKFRVLMAHAELHVATKSAAAPEAPEEKVDLNENKKKILNFIQHSPVRTKEIVDEFKLLSSRTVKRSLKELIRAGLVQKKSKDNSVIYFAAE